ncbi:transposase of ISThsp13, IS1380 family [Methylocaldum marinum]|uniref:Transposase of ISThsp13, IS1380 family n=2 Tax=Methylocaldum marinum TaxID=1432792 RepID=A0A250L0E4_9GAMM|nr:transposase of ISThsp13, IS1380 family [Methylocaldum marinum]
MTFGRLGRRVIEANFQGGAISSDGGVMLLRQLDRRLGLSKAVARALSDPRDPDRITHPLQDLIAQRLYGLWCGYEDLNDHDRLRHDPLLQTAVGKVTELASSPTLSRLETRASRADLVALNRVLIEPFIASQPRAPRELILDIDASDVPLHGDQELTQFHGYYDHYCYLPLYVFCGQALLTCLLRPSRIDGAKPSAAVIKRLVTRLRQAWPTVRIIVRGDSGFCRQRLLRGCERHDDGYVIGVARNARLHKAVAAWEDELKAAFAETGLKQRSIHEFRYAADAWNIERRLITRLEFGAQGTNPRVVVTNLDFPADALYDRLYCPRGEADPFDGIEWERKPRRGEPQGGGEHNRIKEAQLDLFGTRASCHRFLANGLRLMFAALAYTLMQRLRELALAGTELARATAATIRVRLLKIGASVLRNTRRVRILLASHHPQRETFLIAVRALAP